MLLSSPFSFLQSCANVWNVYVCVCMVCVCPLCKLIFGNSNKHLHKHTPTTIANTTMARAYHKYDDKVMTRNAVSNFVTISTTNSRSWQPPTPLHTPPACRACPITPEALIPLTIKVPVQILIFIPGPGTVPGPVSKCNGQKAVSSLGEDQGRRWRPSRVAQ